MAWASTSTAQTVPIIDSLKTPLDTIPTSGDSLRIEADSLAPIIADPAAAPASSTLQPTAISPEGQPDSLNLTQSDSLGLTQPDSLANTRPPIIPPTSGRPPTGRPQPTTDLSAVTLSKDGLDEDIEYTSSDSMKNDITGKKIYLYGNAEVKYTSMNITAHQIILDMENNIVMAECGTDSLGKRFGIPAFTDGSQDFTANKIRYNFKSRKGIIYDITTQQGDDMYLKGSKAKLFSPADTTKGDNVVYSSNAIFTTCNHDHPHFGIRSRRQKVIANKMVVVGASNLEIAGIPSPVWLPFGFFPLKKGKRTGLIFPRDYEFSPTWGFGFRNVGWFFPLNDNMNLTLTGDIYTRGTWGLTANSQYKKRYKYSGNLSLGYSYRKDQDNVGLPIVNRSWNFRWSHRQEATAHPTNTFSVSANIQTNNFQSFNQNDANSVLTNTLSSNISFTKKLPGTPFRFSLSASHSQNTQNRTMNISLPVANFQMDRIYPFKNRNRGGNEEKWFEKISLQYTMDAQNRFQATDTTLFSRQTLEDAQYGVRHTVSSNAAFRVFKFFNFTPNINYKENWYFNTLRREFDPTVIRDTLQDCNADSSECVEVFDTTSYGTVTDFRDLGFTPLRLFDVNMSLNTQIFGTRVFGRGFIRGIRHVIKPSISFNFTPDYTRESLGYYRTVQTDIRQDDPDEFTTYSIFDQAIYDRPTNQGRVMGLSYSLNNIFEAKYFSRRDSSIKKLKLFDNIFLGGNYNFVADSLKWSQVTARGAARFFKGITNVSFTAVFDPYAAVVTDNNTNRRINTFYWDTNKRLLRFDRVEFRLTTNLTVGQIRDFFKKSGSGGGGSTSGLSSEPRRFDDDPSGAVSIGNAESLLDVLANFRVSHNFTVRVNRIDGRDTTVVQAHTLRFSGRIKLTDSWNINVGNVSYDFRSGRLVYPDLGFSRDLHCWEMGMNWQPARGTYSFFIRVKPGTLDFINIPYKKNNADGFGGF